MAKKRASNRRELIENKTGDYFAKRGAKGKFTSMDGRKKSLSADAKRRAKKTVKSGFGDQGDARRKKR